MPFIVVEVDNDGFQILDPSGNPVGSVLDGSDYRLLVQALLKAGHGLATEAKQNTLIGHVDGVEGLLTSLNGKDYATQSTLSSALTTLNAIKNTDGVKKITDPLPAGTNQIGAVTQGTDKPWTVEGTDADGAPPTENPVLTAGYDGTNVQTKLTDTAGRQRVVGAAADGVAAVGDPVLMAGADGSGNVQTIRTNTVGRIEQVVYDGNGNAIGVVLDGALYRFQCDAKVAKGLTSGDLVHLETIDTISGHGRLKASIYTPDGDPVAFGAISASIKNHFLEDGSSNHDLNVDGSVTPVVFTYPADSTYDISIQEIKFTLVSNSITFGSDYFGATSGPLTNGMLVEAVVESGTVELYNMDRNESFVNFASPGGFEWVVSSKDMMTSNYLIGGGLKLRANSADVIRVTVRDDIDSCGNYFRCFVKGNLLTEI